MVLDERHWLTTAAKRVVEVWADVDVLLEPGGETLAADVMATGQTDCLAAVYSRAGFEELDADVAEYIGVGVVDDAVGVVGWAAWRAKRVRHIGEGLVVDMFVVVIGKLGVEVRSSWW
jgi:hypothetical protein